MLSWICPDCGCDCAPTDHDCPDCSDLVQAGMLALAQSVQAELVSLPPPVDIPLENRLPGGFRLVGPRALVAGALRVIEPHAELPKIRPVLPSAFGVAETQHPTAPPPPAAPQLVIVAAPPGLPRKRTKLPGWLLSLIVATVLSLGGAAIIRNMSLENKSEAATTPAVQVSAAPQNAFARYVEVTGLRVLVDLKHTSQVRYIVVNHSSTLLSNLALRIAVRSTLAPNSAKPLFTVSALVTGLAPYESREVAADIEELTSREIPDWDHLKPEVQVVSQ